MALPRAAREHPTRVSNTPPSPCLVASLSALVAQEAPGRTEAPRTVRNSRLSPSPTVSCRKQELQSLSLTQGGGEPRREALVVRRELCSGVRERASAVRTRRSCAVSELESAVLRDYDQ
jgi:hypothetical protein